MGFFDGLLGAAATAYGGPLLGAAVTAGANAIGGALSSDGTEEAAGISRQATADQLAELRRSKDAGIGYIDQGASKAEGMLQPLLSQAPIMLPTNRGLTEQQQIGQADLIRSGQTALAASGLRGAGRAGVSALMDSVNRYQAAARGANDAADLTARQGSQQTQNNARGTLANLYSTTGSQKANTELGVGSQSSSVIGQGGQQQSGYAQTAGNTAGNAVTAIGGNIANGVGGLFGWNAGMSPNQGGTDPAQERRQVEKV